MNENAEDWYMVKQMNDADSYSKINMAFGNVPCLELQSDFGCSFQCFSMNFAKLSLHVNLTHPTESTSNTCLRYQQPYAFQWRSSSISQLHFPITSESNGRWLNSKSRNSSSSLMPNSDYSHQIKLLRGRALA